uniref:Uncharacterized protein n=1 Tax=Rhizophora mucronata TaxID=61149 RepID=A0A2P2ITB4_RHIMU
MQWLGDPCMVVEWELRLHTTAVGGVIGKMSQSGRPSSGNGRPTGNGSFIKHPLPRGEMVNKIPKAALGLSPSSGNGQPTGNGSFTNLPRPRGKAKNDLLKGVCGFDPSSSSGGK